MPDPYLHPDVLAVVRSWLAADPGVIAAVNDRISTASDPGTGAAQIVLYSVTGAPKLQAMKVIADYETPRGPYCGSLFWAGVDGALEASVLIRTVALLETAAGWTFEARAGGGIVADSEARAEVAETTAKIGAILRALTDSA